MYHEPDTVPLRECRRAGARHQMEVQRWQVELAILLVLVLLILTGVIGGLYVGVAA